MDQEVKDEGVEELRVEHVFVVLDRIVQMAAELRLALDGMDPKAVLTRRHVVQDPGGGTGAKYTLGQC
jgi:hypothetical protein